MVDEPTPTDWAWAAGIFEGEGCVSVSRSGTRTIRQLVIQMTDEDVLRRFHDVVGCGSLFPIKQHATWQEHWKPAWRWASCAWADQVRIYEQFRPWLGTRRSAKFAELLTHPPIDPTALRKSRCKRGHPLNGPGSDVYVVGTRRQCRHCRRECRAARAS